MYTTGKPHPICIWCNIINALIAFVIVAPIVWMAIDRTPPYSLDPVSHYPEPVHPGLAITTVWDVDVSVNGCTGSFQRIYTAPSTATTVYEETVSAFAALPVGHHTGVISAHPFHIPESLVSGKGKLFTVSRMLCNPLQRLLNWPIIYYSPPIVFTVEADVIVKGDKGDTGKTGSPGKTGLTGDTGDKGDKGDKGDAAH